jgi:hypothetical protein
METIKKITKLKKLEGFLQINTVQGFKYVDRAGEIVNHFFNDDQEPLFHMDLNGLTINEPDSSTKEIKITPRMIWAHYLDAGSLEEMSNHFHKFAEKIVEILEIKEIKRVGWRNYFAKDFGNTKERDEVFDSLSKIKDINLAQASFELNLETNIKCNIRLLKIHRAEEDADKKVPAILFDIDTIFEERQEVGHLKDILLRIKNSIVGDKLLQVVNNILEKKYE